ncbi:MAG TPA: VOC family protein [Actinomycetota bacterium]|jgi:glyoxylase I family protein|nr:VOC family protein [Actinomycetota bacterium]
MPEFSGLSHVSLSVRDRDTSRDWYERILGFQMIEESLEEAYVEWILLHADNRTIVCLQQHKANKGEPFDPTRTGGDHIGFKVDSRAELDEWTAWFTENDVVHSPIADRPYGSVLCFKDPDGFQLEMFYRENHP